MFGIISYSYVKDVLKIFHISGANDAKHENFTSFNKTRQRAADNREAREGPEG